MLNGKSPIPLAVDRRLWPAARTNHRMGVFVRHDASVTTLLLSLEGGLTTISLHSPINTLFLSQQQRSSLSSLSLSYMHFIR